MSAQAGVASYHVEDGVAVLTIDSPPVNALCHAVRIALRDGVAQALADETARALVLACAGRTFFAGADVTEIGKPILPPLLADVMALFESSAKPIVAAMHGTALGGGLELALACHYRVAVPSAIVGLPEVALGLLPGAGGTQRVPRLIGVAAAVEMIGLGQRVPAAKALETGLIDALVEEGQLVLQSIVFARKLVAEQAPLRRLRDLAPDLNLEQASEVFAAFRAAHPALFTGVKAADGVLRAIEASITLPFAQGIEREREISRELTASPESAAQRHLFFAERTAAKLPGHDKDKPANVAALTVLGDDALEARLRGAGVALVDPHEGAKLTIVAGIGAETLADADAAVGLSVLHGVAQIVVGLGTPSAAALAVQVLVRKAGWPSIFVRPAPGLVLARMEQRLRATVSNLLAEGVAPDNLRATGEAFGFAAALLPEAGLGGRAEKALERRLLQPLLAEARALLEEGVALRESDVDFALVRAGLWPLWRGGPCHHAGLAGG